MLNTKIIRTFGTAALALGCSVGLAGCASDTEEQVGEQSEKVVAGSRVDTVRELLAARGSQRELRDEPAELAFRRLKEAKSARRALAADLAVYDLGAPEDPVTRLSSRAKELAVDVVTPADEKSGQSESGIVAQGDVVKVNALLGSRPWELHYNATSGSERFFDRDAFHVGHGPMGRLDVPALIGAARSFSAKVRAENRGSLHLYKTRTYKNAYDREGVAPVEEVYGFAVAFNTDIDGVPVIGSGGKVTVHLGAGARATSYETSVAPVAKKRGAVNAGGLLDPDAAVARAWAKLAEAGLGPETHDLTSSQFGYHKRGRASVQTVIAPAFAFFFTPKGEFGKKRVEVIPAVTDSALAAQVAADDAAEQSRKAELVQPDER